ncbi:MAG: hypothetical protein RLZZ67_689 [Candidatus Parcubacteria bacterium]|jgi:hypothetical protein
MILDLNILIGVLAFLLLLVVTDLFFLRLKIKKLLRGEKNENLGESIASISTDIKNLEEFRGDMEKYLIGIEKRMRRSCQATETIRFNAFRGDGVGGNQSFATAFLNEDGDGSILSSLYSRDRVSIFAKPIVKFNSEIELSEEERRAVSLAKSKLSNK